MCWMAVHSFTASHGREGQHTKRYAQCTQGMSQKSMEKQLSCLMVTVANPRKTQRMKGEQKGMLE